MPATLPHPDIIEGIDPAARRPDSAIGCAREVLDAYALVLAKTRSEVRAFDQAARIYQARNPQTSSEEARRAVAIIFCNMP